MDTHKVTGAMDFFVPDSTAHLIGIEWSLLGLFFVVLAVQSARRAAAYRVRHGRHIHGRYVVTLLLVVAAINCFDVTRIRFEILETGHPGIDAHDGWMVVFLRGLWLLTAAWLSIRMRDGSVLTYTGEGPK